ncbi:hypothetical protein CP533_1810 [Ophiocordyceps camponoti-saundersi (nom. inval.)]|nr:hypothetical protein CP533_1810 [Ophiocordyceps camponoti-saundersi (nom. inval.)]
MRCLSILSWLLFSSLGNARPSPPNDSTHILHPRTPNHDPPEEADKSKADKSFFLFRGEVGAARAPSYIRLAGGFGPENPGYEQYESSFSIRHHIRGRPSPGGTGSDFDSDSDSERSSLALPEPSTDETIWHTAFVSLSYRPNTAAFYASDMTEPGYLYIVAPSPNIIDPSSIPDLEWMASINEEVVALGGVQFSQIYGWMTCAEFNEIEQDLLRDARFAPVDDDTDFVRELGNRVLQHATANPLYDIGWSTRRLTTERTSDFSSSQEATMFMDSLNNGITGWHGRFPLQLGLNSHGLRQPGVGNRIHGGYCSCSARPERR